MSREVNRVRELCRLTELKLRAEEARFAEQRRREMEIRALLSDISSERAARMSTVGQTPDAAFVAGADMRWLRWVDQRRAVLNSELARVLAAQDRLRGALRHAFGQNQAAKALLDRKMSERALARARRADWA